MLCTPCPHKILVGEELTKSSNYVIRRDGIWGHLKLKSHNNDLKLSDSCLVVQCLILETAFVINKGNIGDKQKKIKYKNFISNVSSQVVAHCIGQAKNEGERGKRSQWRSNSIIYFDKPATISTEPTNQPLELLLQAGVVTTKRSNWWMTLPHS